jgi:hypothetical protein
MASGDAVAERQGSTGDPSRPDIVLLFYIGVPAITAMLFAMNKAGMARILPGPWGLPYWFGITLPLWLLLDLCSRGLHLVLARFQPHRWLLLLGGSLIAMALFSAYVPAYVGLFQSLALGDQPYPVATPFPDAFLDLRRFASYSSVPIYWIAVSLFFARYFGFPRYLVARPELPAVPAPAPSGDIAPALNAYNLPERHGFRALLPYHLGTDMVSLSAEDHYVRVVTDHGNALIRYRFSDALSEVRGLPGIQVHRSHWVAVRAIERVRSSGKTYCLVLKDGSEFPVSRTNVGVLREAGLI